ncbi:TRAFAC clade GTPase domain-containing protein [Microbulbifer sp. PSTR4-B]|uniref:TRAFAC clade GTPase domain-containing protein n=1 Tax=Microbulbifer sp. PSTR4-B TaxID=3243396 RepID=UPI0040397AE3
MAGKCSNPQCQIEETGLCLEGFEDLGDCSSYNGDLVEEVLQSPADTVPAIQELAEDKINLMGRLPLDPETADALLKNKGGRIIACVGPANVGKTTLFASLYDLLQEGPIVNWNFGGSATIYPFEELCHSARSTSRRDRPETPRTFASDGLNFYHLSLYDKSSNREELFLADRAGELYSNAADSSQACEQLYEVSRADIVLMLVDAESLGDKAKRHLAKRQALNIIQAFSESAMINEGTKVIITLTRYDLAVKAESNELATTEHQRIIDSAKETLGPGITVVGEIIAARPDSIESVEPGQGIPSLLGSIVDHKVPKAKIAPNDPEKASRTFLDQEFAL